MDNLERATQLYTQANQETDPTRRAGLFAEADSLIEDEDSHVYESEEEVSDDELAAYSDAGITFNEIDLDDDIEFEPSDELTDAVNGEAELEN